MATSLSSSIASFPAGNLLGVSPLFCNISQSDCIELFRELAADPFELCSTGNCIRECQDLSFPFAESGDIYDMCFNLPSIVRMSQEERLPPALGSQFDAFVPPNTTVEDLQQITTSLTQCLVSSCDSARNSTYCSPACSFSNILVNNTQASPLGVSQCMKSLCNSTNSLPFGNSDIVGIGVRLQTLQNAQADKSRYFSRTSCNAFSCSLFDYSLSFWISE